MWASGHNGDINRAAHSYERTRETAMVVRMGEEAAFWLRIGQLDTEPGAASRADEGLHDKGSQRKK